eukprot:TRINITY_DN2582_c0_g1_i2.p1 TRINITY_DN2582_c0_g1~~TRINITY_DN2582_c0_g1_i2.p1  ORF type:complete len:1048 (-),score=227.62 TRINITY_DN2582_c0_g1_i2:98-3241(-)
MKKAEYKDAVDLAADEIVRVTKETAATLFAGLDLDIPTDEDDDDTLPERMTKLSPFFAEVSRVQSAFGELSSAVMRGEKASAMAQCQSIAAMIAGLDIDDSDLDMRLAAQRLADAMRDLFGATRAVLANPHDLKAKAEFDRCMAVVDGITNDMNNRSVGAISDPVVAHGEAVQQALAQMQGALVMADRAVIHGAVGVVSKAVGALLNDLDADSKDRLREALANVAGALKDLTDSSSAYGANPRDYAALERAQKAIGALAGAANIIVDRVSPATGGLDLGDQMQIAAAKSLQALGAVVPSIQQSPEAVVSAIKTLNSATGAQASLARLMAENDAVMLSNVMDVSGKMAQALQYTVMGVKRASAQPDDPQARQELSRALAMLGEHIEGLASVVLEPSDQLFDIHSRLQQALDDLEKAVKRGDLKAAEKAQNDLTSAIKAQLTLAKSLTDKYPQGKADILNACRGMAAALNSLNGFTQAALSNPRDRAAQERFAQAHAALSAAALALTESGANAAAGTARGSNNGVPPTQSWMLLNAARIDDLSRLLDDLIVKGKKADAMATSAVLEKAINKQVTLAKMAAAKTVNVALQRSLLDVSNQLAHAMSGLSDHTIEAATSNDPRAKAQLDEQLRRIAKLNADLMAGTLTAAEASASLDALADALQNVVRGIGTVSGSSYTDLLAVVDALAQEIELGKYVASQCKDPARKAQIENALKAAGNVLQNLRSATANLRKNPHDASLHRQIQEYLSDASKTSRVLSNLCAAPVEEQLVSNGVSLNRDIAGANDALSKGDVAAFKSRADDASRKVLQQITNARDVAANSAHYHPALHRILLTSADRLQELQPEYNRAVGAAAANPGNSQAKADVARVGKSIVDENNKIVDAAKRVIAKEQPPAAPRLDVSRVTTVTAASDVLAQATRNLRPDNTPLGRIHAASKSIGNSMAKLSAAAQRGDKKAMIEAARELATQVNELTRHANSVAQTCSDVETRDKLMSMAVAGKNFGTQLKILCAVKASTEGTDQTAEGQLVTCAKGLVSSVLECLNYGEIAALKK